MGRRWIGAGLAVVVIAIAVFVLAQGGGSGGGPLNAIAKAAEVTQREPGGHAVFEATVTSSTTLEGVTETGSMIFDDTGKAEGTFSTRARSTGKEVELTSIADGTTAYVSSEALDSLPEGKKWMELDLSSAKVKGQGSPPTEASPREGLQILERVEGAKKIGTEEVDGVPTTHYTGIFPPTEEVFGVKIDSSAPRVDVWIDGQDRVRRMKVSVTTSVNHEGPTDTEMTIDYVDFGRVPKIELPPANEVFNVTGKVESEVQAATEGN